MIPSARFNPIAVNYLKYFPEPNQISSVTARTTTLPNTIRHDDYFTVLERLDFNFSTKHKLFSRYQAFYRTEHVCSANVLATYKQPCDSNRHQAGLVERI